MPRPVLFFAVFGMAAAARAATPACGVRSADRIVPLVELYTSEGCSSCPPADRWLSARVADGADGANWLAFHVDYWDALGWRDRFASPRHTQRQRARVAAAGGSTVYTPQVMIGPRVQVTWRAAPMLRRALEAAGGPARAGLALRLLRAQGGDVLRLGAAPVAGAPAAEVWLARSVDGRTSPVRAGENAGATLHHDRVVVDLWGPWRLDGAPVVRTLALPAGAEGDFTAFVQADDGRVLQSLRLAGAACR
ncbi:MAG: DUF1223 domain-containing protein [Xanthomonadales bacterium]|nr:DUF1223 domain-containing protein [Xanthomonadales bacterium]